MSTRRAATWIRGPAGGYVGWREPTTFAASGRHEEKGPPRRGRRERLALIAFLLEAREQVRPDQRAPIPVGENEDPVASNSRSLANT